MKLNRFFYIVIIFVFFSCASPVEQKSINGSSSTSLLPDLNLDNGIEVVTWNIENFPKLGQRTIDSVFNIITNLNADIYCLQEISNRNSFQDLVDELIVSLQLLQKHSLSWRRSIVERLSDVVFIEVLWDGLVQQIIGNLHDLSFLVNATAFSSIRGLHEQDVEPERLGSVVEIGDLCI